MEYRAELVYPYGDFVGTDSINFIIEVLEETYQLFWLDVFKHSHLEILYFRTFRFRILSNLDLKGMTRTFLFYLVCVVVCTYYYANEIEFYISKFSDCGFCQILTLRVWLEHFYSLCSLVIWIGGGSICASKSALRQLGLGWILMLVDNLCCRCSVTRSEFANLCTH